MRILRLGSAAAVVLTSIAVLAIARAPKTPPCSGTFVVSGGPLVTGGVATGTGDAIVVQGKKVAIASGCAPRAGKVKGTATGTKVKAAWPRCGALRRVRLNGLIAPGCTAMTGTVVAKQHPATAFTASGAGTTTTLPVGPSCPEAPLVQVVQAGGTLQLDCDGTVVVSDTLVVAAGTTVTIDGGGHHVTISGDDQRRIFDVEGTLTLRHLTLAHGRVIGDLGSVGLDGADGDAGERGKDGVPQFNSVASDTATAGDEGTAGVEGGDGVGGGTGGDGEGGAIRIKAGGVVTVDDVTFLANVAVGGLGGSGPRQRGLSCNGPDTGAGPGCGNGGRGGWGGYGGSGYYAMSGIGANGGAGGEGGKGGNGGDGGEGGKGRGGAIANAGSLTVLGCIFDGNAAQGGDGGAGEFGSYGGDGGRGGLGGDTSRPAPSLDAPFNPNAGRGGFGGQAGAGGDGGAGGGGGEGDGGAIYDEGALVVRDTLFRKNAALGGNGGSGGNGGGGGGDAAAGAGGRFIPCCSSYGQHGNGGNGGNGGAGGDVGDGGTAEGGAIRTSAAAELTGLMHDQNAATGGSGGRVGCFGVVGCAGQAGGFGYPTIVLGTSDGSMNGEPGESGEPGKAGKTADATDPDVSGH